MGVGTPQGAGRKQFFKEKCVPSGMTCVPQPAEPFAPSPQAGLCPCPGASLSLSLSLSLAQVGSWRYRPPPNPSVSPSRCPKLPLPSSPSSHNSFSPGGQFPLLGPRALPDVPHEPPFSAPASRLRPGGGRRRGRSKMLTPTASSGPSRGGTKLWSPAASAHIRPKRVTCLCPRDARRAPPLTTAGPRVTAN